MIVKADLFAVNFGDGCSRFINELSPSFHYEFVIIHNLSPRVQQVSWRGLDGSESAESIVFNDYL